MYGDAQPWLWRGQANSAFLLEPGMHTRIKKGGKDLDDPTVSTNTDALIASARIACLDMHEGTKLPDMALMASLQHHGAATPLLDVSLDPMVALYMAVVSPSVDDQKKDGVLFAIKKPKQSVVAFDSRRFATIYGGLAPDDVIFYSAPDVSERLRIQRGHFLLGKVSRADDRVTIPLTLDSARPLANSWIWKRLNARRRKGMPPSATTDVAVFRVTKDFKEAIQAWLEQRSGLTRDFVYPTTWHQPHLERFAASHGRTASL
jgi:hypothetical protein